MESTSDESTANRSEVRHRFEDLLSLPAGALGRMPVADAQAFFPPLPLAGQDWVAERDSFHGQQFSVGRYDDVVATVEAGLLELAEPAGDWVVNHHVAMYRNPERAASLALGDLPSDELATIINSEVRRLAASRRARFVRCRRCGRPTPPEFVIGGDQCMGCAERYNGVRF